MNENKVKRIGYWHSEKEDYPDPGYFIDHDWDPAEKKTVASYLDQGEQILQYRGRSWCRFRCGIPHTGSREYSDGYYIWPEGLSHYVSAHNVKLPQEVIEHILSGRLKRIEVIQALKTNHAPENINSDWWKAQRGHSNTYQLSYKTIKDDWNQPFHVYCQGPTVSLRDKGRYQIVMMKELGSLVTDNEAIIVNKELGVFLKSLMSTLTLAEVIIFRKATGQEWSGYYQLGEIETYNSALNSPVVNNEFKAWIGVNGGLFVTEKMKKALLEYPFNDLTFQRN